MTSRPIQNRVDRVTRIGQHNKTAATGDIGKRVLGQVSWDRIARTGQAQDSQHRAARVDSRDNMS